ncbi:hypothetical protein WS50_20285 [Burkholderia territorii]|nr:hypothetical protein WS47_25985 [Burkholderia territorii]KUZ09882.1 hypothetical protein WS50_20285 [Burkholderia territorii]
MRHASAGSPGPNRGQVACIGANSARPPMPASRMSVCRLASGPVQAACAGPKRPTRGAPHALAGDPDMTRSAARL